MKISYIGIIFNIRMQYTNKAEYIFAFLDH